MTVTEPCRFTGSDAVISDDGIYRYRLQRIWDGGLGPWVLFIMLNPSTADAFDDDPTIRRCIGFAKSWGFGGMLVCNLFALRSTSPKSLYESADPLGSLNNAYIGDATRYTRRTICAWGAHGSFCGAGEKMLSSLEAPYCFGVTKNKQPKHPLYLRRDAEALPYKDFLP